MLLKLLNTGSLASGEPGGGDPVGLGEHGGVLPPPITRGWKPSPPKLNAVLADDALCGAGGGGDAELPPWPWKISVSLEKNEPTEFVGD